MNIKKILLSFALLSLTLNATASDSLKQAIESSGIQAGFAVVLGDDLLGKEVLMRI